MATSFRHRARLLRGNGRRWLLVTALVVVGVARRRARRERRSSPDGAGRIAHQRDAPADAISSSPAGSTEGIGLGSASSVAGTGSAIELDGLRIGADAPEADMIDQHQDAIPDAFEVDPAVIPFETSVADYVDQLREVPLDDEEIRAAGPSGRFDV